MHLVQHTTPSPSLEVPPAATPRRNLDLRRVGPLVALALYLALALVAWWHAWAGGLSASVPAGSIDPVEAIWYFAWVLHVIGHPTNPFYTHAIFAPGGTNVLTTPSTLALGLLFAPLTAAAGPIASFAVALTLTPVAGAFAAFWVARRYCSWQPAAFVAGLCYGFGPFAVSDLRVGHLNLAFLPIPPLVLACLDALVVRGTTKQLRTGLALALLLIVEFFVSTEIVALIAVEVLVALGIALALGPRTVVARLRGAWRGLAVTAVVSAAALAYPLWTTVVGPGHITGPVWKTIPQFSSTVLATVLPHGERRIVDFVSTGNGAYLGVPLLALLVCCPFLWRTARTLRLAVSMAAISFLLSLGYTLHVGQSDTHVPLPAWVLGRLPLLDSIAPSHFAVFVDLFAGLAVALVLDRLRRGDLGVRAVGRATPALALSGVVAATVVLPLLPVLRWPYGVDHVSQPAVLRRPPLANSRSSDILIEYPGIDSGQAQAMLWQAEAGLPYALHDGYSIRPALGGGGNPFEMPDAVELIFAAAQLGRLQAPLPGPTLHDVRAAILADGARFVVVVPHTRQSAIVMVDLSLALGKPSTPLAGGGGVWVLPRTAADGAAGLRASR